MARTQRELWANIQHPQFGGPVFPVTVGYQPGTTNAELVVFVAPRNVAIRRAFVAARNDLGGGTTVTLNLENTTDSEDLATSLDATASGVDLDGNDYAEWTLNDNADLIEEGDIIVVDYDSDTDPGELVVVLDVEYLEIKND